MRKADDMKGTETSTNSREWDRGRGRRRWLGAGVSVCVCGEVGVCVCGRVRPNAGYMSGGLPSVPDLTLDKEGVC